MVFEKKVFIKEEGKMNPFYLGIHTPEMMPGEEDYSCQIDLPGLFKKEKYIFGDDEEQTIQLAKEFLKNILDGKKFFDKNGNPVDIL